MASTQHNLKEAFAGESQANQRYLGFAREAEDAGRPMIARLFRAAAAAETVHAQNHLDAMGAIEETLQNLETARSGEAHEFKEMYPEFLESAREQEHEEGEATFDYAMQVEKIHHALYGEAIETLTGGQDLPERDIYVCRGCGNTVYDEAPEKCPICGAPKAWFMHIE
ncbi:MAG: rubrerythrin family protein [Candidatus Brocadiaceae bacterium]|jgi:rubrerythrin